VTRNVGYPGTMRSRRMSLSESETHHHRPSAELDGSAQRKCRANYGGELKRKIRSTTSFPYLLRRRETNAGSLPKQNPSIPFR
jgi:hypothetical protein